MKKIKHFSQSLAVLVSLSFSLIFFPQVNAQSLIPSLSFANPQLIAGSNGSVGAVYRFSRVRLGVDALVTIQDADNATLANLDLPSTGSYDAFQPQVKIVNQNRRGAEAHMDFLVEFVISGTYLPTVLLDWTATAIDVDGDGYRLREAVSFYNTSGFTLEESTALLTEVTGNQVTFEAASIYNYEGIDTTATEHMVYAVFKNRSSFVYRTKIIDDGARDGDSNADERMFSLNFNPGLIDNFLDEDSFPVEWAVFDAIVTPSGVELDWATLTEINNDFFDVERSLDGSSFSSLGKVKGAGSSSEINNYAFLDANPQPGTNYYRLKQVDLDGESSYSHTIEVNMGIEDAISYRVYPNPTADFLTVETTGISVIGMTLLDANGKVILKEGPLGAASRLTFNISDLSPGIYYLNIEDEVLEITSKKIIIR